MATKIIKALVDGVVKNIEVEDIISPELLPSVEERVEDLEESHKITDGNFLVGNGDNGLVEMTPEETLFHINGASVVMMTSAEIDALEDKNAATIYIPTDIEESYTKLETDSKLLLKADSDHNHNDVYDAKGTAEEKANIVQTNLDAHEADTTKHITSAERTNWNAAKTHVDSALATAKAYSDGNLSTAKYYTDTKIDALVGEGASETLDTIGEISAAIEEHQDVTDALNSAIGNKANASDLTSHTSNKSNPHGVTLAQLGVTATASEVNVLDGITATTTELNYMDGVTSNVQTQLNGKAASSHGTHVSYSTTAPKMDGTASAGSASTVARTDHVHPTDTSRASVTALEEVEANLTELVNKKANASHGHEISDITNLQTILDSKAASSHSHTITASASDDDVVVLTGTNGTNKVTYSASHANSGVTAGTYKSVTVNAKGHVTGGTNPTTLSGYGITDAYTKTQVDSIASGKSDTGHTHNYAGSSSAGGSANSAVKWSTARNINGMSVDGSVNRVNYGECPTDAATAAKTVACTGFALVTGAEITVKFTVSNTASSPTLNVNSTGAKPIYYRGSAITASYLAANRTYTFRYDGTSWNLVGDINVDTNTDTKVTQTATTTSADYRVLFSGTADDTSRAETARKSSNLKFNPSTGTLTANTFSGALSGNATTATKVGTSTVGSATQPVYISSGVPTKTTYTLGKSVPSDAKFTDTVYTHPSYTARTSEPTANQTPSFGGTATVSQITSDSTGHVTGVTDRTITIPSTLSNGTGTAGLIKTSSTVTSNSGYTACPVISGVPYYKDTNTTYNLGSFGITATATELNYCDGVTSNIQTQINTLNSDLDANQEGLEAVASEISVLHNNLCNLVVREKRNITTTSNWYLLSAKNGYFPISVYACRDDTLYCVKGIQRRTGGSYTIIFDGLTSATTLDIFIVWLYETSNFL